MAAKMPSRASEWWRAVAVDQFRVVEVVAGVEADAFGQGRTQGHLVAGVQQGNLDAVHLVRVVADQGQERLRGRGDVVGAPVAGQGGIEHGAEPVQDDGLVHFLQQRGVHVQVVFRTRWPPSPGHGRPSG